MRIRLLKKKLEIGVATLLKKCAFGVSSLDFPLSTLALSQTQRVPAARVSWSELETGNPVFLELMICMYVKNYKLEGTL